MANEISLQLSNGRVVVTCQVEGTPYSPDVVNDLLTQLSRTLATVGKDTPHDGEATADVISRLELLLDEEGNEYGDTD